MGCIIVVTGGRHYHNQDHVFMALSGFNTLYEGLEIVHGDCPTGVDALAKKWALQNNIPQHPHPANWLQYGRAAGPIRNKSMFMLHEIDFCIAFPGGKGTAHCIKIAKAFHVRVVFPIAP